MADTGVVVTGMGAVTPLGLDVQSTWQALLEGRSGARLLDESWAGTLPVRIAAPVAGNLASLLPAGLARRLDRSAQLALLASREAWQQSGSPEVDGKRLGVAIGTSFGGISATLKTQATLLHSGPQEVSPLSIPMLSGNAPAVAVALERGAHATLRSPMSACASGAEAILSGAALIRSGQADVMICGGTDAPIGPVPLAAFAAMRALSRNHESPAAASRPFDRNRDGFVLGEGGAVLVLESEAHARARGAKRLASVLGAGETSDAYDPVAPDPSGEGMARAICEALRQAGAHPADVRQYSAHATSTPLGDAAEARAIRKALGRYADDVPVTAIKGGLGHLLGAAGAIQAIITVCSLAHGLVPPIRNLDESDGTGDLCLVRSIPRAARSGMALTAAAGFGGINVVLAFGTP